MNLQIYDSSSIWTFHNLVTHKGANKQAPELMMQCLAAIFLLRCLKAKKFYQDSSEDPRELTQTEVFISKLVHHFMRVTYYNTHEVKLIYIRGHPSMMFEFRGREGVHDVRAFMIGVNK